MATRLLNQGMPIHSLRKLLGHQNLGTTQIYARIYDETLYRQFVEAISGLDINTAGVWPGATEQNLQFVAVDTWT